MVVFTPKKTRDYEAAVEEAARAVLGDAMLEQRPMALVIEAFFPRPKRLMRAKDSALPVPHTSKPDADNIAKAIGDGLSLWLDDAWFSSVHVWKWYVAKGATARCEVSIKVEEAPE